MDGFDDLLSSSSRALEVNPFADPFTGPRSGSPDPWATFGQPEGHDSTTADASGYGSHFGSTSGSAYEIFTGETNEHSGKQHPPHDEVSSQEVHSLERESASPNTPPPEASPVVRPFPLSPGFRESVSNDDASAEDAKEATSEQLHSPASPIRNAEDLFSVEESAAKLGYSASPPVSSTAQTTPSASSSFAAQSNAFVSPLDNSFSSAIDIDKPFASLALGGESVGGWQDDDVPVATSSLAIASAEKDDDLSLKSSTEAPQGSSPTFVISVDDPQKVGDAIRPYILYTVRTRTTSPLFSKPTCSVLRRYSDFLWLFETLSLNNPGVVVPPVPEKSSFGRFESHFVQQRRMALERCIQKIANHTVLAKDPDLKFFLESDSFALDIKHRKLEIAQDRGGIMSSIGQSMTGAKFYEVDDWFDKKRTYLDSLEVQLKALVKAIETVSKQRADLAVATGEFAVAIGELSSSELSSELSHSLSSLAEVEKQLQTIHNGQAEDDINTLLSTADEYVRLINSVRMAFVSRIRCYTQWQNAESEARRVKQTHEKGRSSGKIPQDRISHSLSQVADAERRSIECKHEFDKCGKLIKMEFGRFEDERINDLKTALEDLLEGMIRRQKVTITAWEKYQEMLLSKVQTRQRGSRPVVEARS